MTVDRDKGSYRSPGGSETRAGRTILEPLMQFSFQVEIELLGAETDCAVLLTIAFPQEKAGI